MLSTARRLLLTDGVEACTIDEVARRSGVAKTTIYRHFGTGDALILAAVDGMVRDTGNIDTGSLRGDLEAIQRAYFAMAENPAARSMFVWMVSRSMADAEFAASFRRVRNQPRGPTVLAFQRAIARGEIAPTTDLEAAFHLFQGPFLSKRIIDNEHVDEAQFQRMLDLMMAAFR
jgi:AcrR family transcriptional regulator